MATIVVPGTAYPNHNAYPNYNLGQGDGYRNSQRVLPGNPGMQFAIEVLCLWNISPDSLPFRAAIYGRLVP